MLHKTKNISKKYFPSNQFLRDSLILVGGTVSAQVIVLLVSPILTRIYSPEEFGILSVYSAALAFFTILASLRYELAIPLPEKKEAANHILIVAIFIVTSFTVIILVGVILFGSYFLELTNFEMYPGLIWLLPAGILLVSLHKIFSYWAIRIKAFSTLSKTKFHQGLGMSIGQISLGFLGLGYIGLIVGHIMGFSAGLINLIRKWFQTNKESIQFDVNKAKGHAKRYKNFPLFSTWANMAGVVSTQFPVMIIALLFNPAAAGFYMVAQKVSTGPISVVADSIGKVFYQKAIEKKRTNELSEFGLKIFKILLTAGLIPLILISLIAPDLFSLVFGQEWSVSGQIFMIILPWMISVFVFDPLLSLYLVLEKQKFQLIFQVALLNSVIGLVAGSYFFDDLLIAISIYSSICLITYSVFGVLIMKIAGIELRDIFLIVVKEFIELAAYMSLYFVIVKLITMIFHVDYRPLGMIVGFFLISISIFKKTIPEIKKLRKI